MARREPDRGSGGTKGGGTTTSSKLKRQTSQLVLEKEFIGSGNRVSDIADIVRSEKKLSQENKQQSKGRTNKVKLFPNLGGSAEATLLFDGSSGGTLKDVIFNNKHTGSVLLTLMISRESPAVIANYPDVKGNATSGTFAYLVYSAIIPNIPADTAITTKSAGREHMTTLSELCGLLNPLSSDGDQEFYIYGWTNNSGKIDAVVLL